ncbi:MAG: hypothetical protein KGZ25_06315, partial [Planctomycetes bacterium]|nr:hypothetical protein [Planctomycetota bacterium]
LPLPFSVGIGRKIEPGPCTAGTVDINLKLKVWPLRLPETSRMVAIAVKNAGIPEHIFSF